MTSPRTCRTREKPPEVNERTLAETSEEFARHIQAWLDGKA